MLPAAVAAHWLPWVALALAGFGVGVCLVPTLGRLWRHFLKWAGHALPRWFHTARYAAPLEREEGSERPGLDAGGVHHSPVAKPAGRTPEVPAKAPVHLPRPCHTWRLPVRSLKAPATAALRPQHSFRLAVAGDAADMKHKKPIRHVGHENQIDLQWVRENLKKRYRDKAAAGRTPAHKPDSTKEPPDTMDMDEIRRRLMATYGRRLSGSNQRSPSGSVRESQRGGNTGSGSGSAGTPAVKPFTPSGASGKPEMPVGDAARRWRSASSAGSDAELPSDAACGGPQERPSWEAAEGVAPPSSAAPSGRTLPGDASPVQTPGTPGGAPAGSPLRQEPDVTGTQNWSAPLNSYNPVVRSDGLPHPVVPPENNPRRVPSGPPASGPAASGSATDGLATPYAPGNGINLALPGFHNCACLPPLSLLSHADPEVAPMTQDDLINGGILIEEKLAEFRVKVNVQDAYAGPVITRYEVQPAVGVRGGQVVSLMKDLARTLGVASIRMVETIPGKTCMGLELPNPRRQMIRLSEVLSSEVFQSHPSKLAVALGKDIIGEPVVADLAKAPHLLVAGTTGSGKSVGVNAMILSLLYRTTPDEVRFVMIDPKMLELSSYDGIPHLLAPVVTDMKLAANALNWCVGEMEHRYHLMSGLRVRNLAGYNQKVRQAIAAGELLFDPCSPTSDDPVPLAPLPHVVVVVDELADLMMVAGKKIEELIARLAQKARAAGIHLILATQRPSVDIITGLIKANIPTRIAFQVSSKIDSRTILDQMGAECLLGQGDMLYLPPGTAYLQRVHGAFVADEEVYAVTEYLKQFGAPQYVEGVLEGGSDADEGKAEGERLSDETDPLYDDAVAFVINSRRASISAVQRQLRIGYNRAARIVEQMEMSGLVSPMESNGNRTVLVPARQE